MSDPPNKKWARLKQEYLLGNRYELEVLRREPFGIFLDLGYGTQFGHMLTGIVDIAGGGLPLEVSNWPKPGQVVHCEAIWYRDYSFEIDFRLSF